MARPLLARLARMAPRVATAAIGAALLVGAALHPHVPAHAADQRVVMATHALWRPAHWTLTVAQAAATVAVGAWAAARGRGVLERVGTAALAFGLALGTVGTLVAATALPSLAGTPEGGAFAAVADADLGIGWMCLLLSALGAGLVAAAWLRSARPLAAGLRALGWSAAVGSLALFAAGVAVPYDHWASHAFVLRSGAAALGAGLVWAAVVVPGSDAAAAPDAR